jgi:tRNA threonylcarbamoyl adenosine modification protein (Sua5/YciO/YrdC/YwlC family)
MGKAQVFKINRDYPQGRLIAKAAEVLRDGGIIVHPTDTTYALGVALHNKRGIETLYTIKKKSLKRPLSFICKDLSHISEYGEVSKEAYRTMKRLLPGPYTFILEANKNAPRVTQTPRKEVGIRVPDCLICQLLIEKLGEPLISTSAYVPGGEILSDPEDIMKVLGGQVDLIIDAGIILPEPSTIISFVTQEPVLVRQGKGKFDLFATETA